MMFDLFKRNQPKNTETEDEDPADAVAAMFIKAKCEAGRLVVGLMLDPAEDRATQIAQRASLEAWSAQTDSDPSTTTYHHPS
jgi:hypothetical protein